MGTVKYSGPIASFHCPTEATIRSLKVHFSPKQEGEGTPSPENVRQIDGWDGVEALKSSKNLFDTSKLSCSHPSSSWNAKTETNDMIFENGELSGTVQEGWRDTTVFSQITPFSPGTYTLSFDYINGIKNYSWRPMIVAATYSGWFTAYKSVPTADSDSGHIAATFTADKPFYVSLCLNSFNYAASTAKNKVYNIQLELGSTATPYEPYHGSTTNYTFGVLGKNKFNINLLAAEDIEVVDGVATGTGSAFNRAWRANDTKWIPFEAVPNQRVTLSFKAYTDSNVGEAEDSTGLVVYMHYTDGSKNVLYLKNNELTPTYHSITSNDGKSVSHIGIAYGSRGGNVWHLSEFQIEYNDIATAYEPYNPNHTVYGGWVDLVSGEVVSDMVKYEFTGNENITYTTSWNTNGNFAYYPYSTSTEVAVPFINQSPDMIKCNILTSVSSSFFGINDGMITVIGSAEDAVNRYRYVVWGKNGFGESAQECKAILKELYESGTPLTIVAKVAPPWIQRYQLPPTPTSMQTFLSTNNVWSNADYVEVEYDLHETQDILARKQFIIANQPHTVKASGSLVNFETDMAAALKECKVGFKPVQDLHGYGKPWVGGAGKNLFNAATSIPKKYIDATGNINISDDWSASDFIAAKAETTYALTAPTSASSNTARIAFYDGNQEFISSLGAQEVEANKNVFTTPTNTAYIRISVRTETPTAVQLEVGSSTTSYEPYENICPIEGWNELETYSSKTIDLSPINYTPETINGGLMTYLGDNRYSFTGNLSAITNFEMPINLHMDANKQYYMYIITSSVEDTNFGLSFRGSGVFTLVIKNNDSTVHYISYTPTSDKNYTTLRIKVAPAAKDFTFGLYITEDPATSIITNWSDSAGTIYGGYVDLVTGEVWKTYHEINITELGTYRTLSINKNNNTQISWFLSNHLNAPEATGYIAYSRDGYCSCAPFYVNNYYWDSKCQVNNSTADLVIEGELTAEEVDNWIKAHAPIQIVYPLKTSELITTLTPTQLKSLRGTNNVWSNANGNIELSYWKH